MRDRVAIVTGLVLFLGIVTFPVWYNVAARTAPDGPVVAQPSDVAIARVRPPSVVGSGFSRIASRTCVAPREEMRASHMQLLVRWREDVVRRGDRSFVAYDSHRYDKTLTATCVGCHGDRAKFCDRCHDYAGVTPGCWHCHDR